MKGSENVLKTNDPSYLRKCWFKGLKRSASGKKKEFLTKLLLREEWSASNLNEDRFLLIVSFEEKGEKVSSHLRESTCFQREAQTLLTRADALFMLLAHPWRRTCLVFGFPPALCLLFCICCRLFRTRLSFYILNIMELKSHISKSLYNTENNLYFLEKQNKLQQIILLFDISATRTSRVHQWS